jgi:hypothetical protein
MGSSGEVQITRLPPLIARDKSVDEKGATYIKKLPL